MNYWIKKNMGRDEMEENREWEEEFMNEFRKTVNARRNLWMNSKKLWMGGGIYEWIQKSCEWEEEFMNEFKKTVNGRRNLWMNSKKLWMGGWIYEWIQKGCWRGVVGKNVRRSSKDCESWFLVYRKRISLKLVPWKS